MFDGLRRVIGVLVLDVREAARELRVAAVGRGVDAAHRPVHGEDLHDVLARHVARQPADVQLAGARRRRWRPLLAAERTRAALAAAR